jgi:hypothetical protein
MRAFEELGKRSYGRNRRRVEAARSLTAERR